jgi:peroxidase
VDLIAIDIQRARDLGLGTLNQTRKALGLAPYTSFAELTADSMLQARFQQVYGAIGAVDLFMGGLAERHAPDAAVGPTFQAIIGKQFEALRDGDRFFWRNQGFDRATAERIAATRLSHIIKRNTDTTSITENAFLASGKPVRKPPRAPAGPIDNHGRLGPPFILR